MGRALLKLSSKNASNEEEFLLSKEVTTIGRSRSADVTLQDTSVSRIHVRIELRNGQFYVIDNNSSNGTFINRRKISDSPLRHGDTLIVGRVYFEFLEETSTDDGGRTAALPTLDAEGQPMGMGGTMSVKFDQGQGPAPNGYVEPESESILELDDDGDNVTQEQPIMDEPETVEEIDDTWRPPEPPAGSPPGAQAPPPPPPPPAQIAMPPLTPKKAEPPKPKENPIHNFKKDGADPKLRLIAALIDIGVFFVLYLPAMICGLLGMLEIMSLFSLLAWLMSLFHIIGGWWFYGKTVGKAVLGLRIVDLEAADKEGMTPQTLVKRLIGYIGCSIPMWLGFAFILKDPEGRGLHDQFANTIVIKED